MLFFRFIKKNVYYFAITGINYILKYIRLKHKIVILHCNNISPVFAIFFFANKCSIGENKGFKKKMIKMLALCSI